VASQDLLDRLGHQDCQVLVDQEVQEGSLGHREKADPTDPQDRLVPPARVDREDREDPLEQPVRSDNPDSQEREDPPDL